MQQVLKVLISPKKTQNWKVFAGGIRSNARTPATELPDLLETSPISEKVRKRTVLGGCFLHFLLANQHENETFSPPKKHL